MPREMCTISYSTTLFYPVNSCIQADCNTLRSLLVFCLQCPHFCHSYMELP